MANLGFNMSDVDFEEQSYELIPNGQYMMHLASAEMKKTKRGDGAYLSACFEITKGSMAGRKVWNNFNVANPNPEAERIGREQLKRLAVAVGKPNASDTDQLIEIDFVGTIAVEKGGAGYPDKNIVKGFAATTGTKPAPAPAATQAAAKPSANKGPSDDISDLFGGKEKAPWD